LLSALLYDILIDMNKKFINFYFAAAIFIYVFALALFIKNTFSEYSAGSERCITLSDEYIKNFSEETLTKAIRELEKSNDIAAFSVKQDGKMVAARNESFNFEETTRFIHAKTASISETEPSLTVSLAVYKLNPAAIFENAKKSFFIILGCTLFTIILIILEPLFNKGKEKNKDSDFFDENDIESTVEEENTGTSQDVENNLEDITGAIPTNEENSLNQEGNRESATTLIKEEADATPSVKNAAYSEAVEGIEKEDVKSKETEDPLTADQQHQENDDSLQAVQTEKSTDKEDFDIDIFPKEEKIEIQTLDNTETPLNKKLSELLTDKNREIALFLLCYSGTDELIIENIKSFIIGSYFAEDMIFSYNSSTLALIKPDTDIDAAEDFAADFHNALTEQVMTEKSEISFNIGISSRATRNISAGRLVTEANEALKHAVEDKESHIIGFHVDIEKYNEFMKSKE